MNDNEPIPPGAYTWDGITVPEFDPANPIPHPQHFRADLHEAKDLFFLIQGLPVNARIQWLRMCCMEYSKGASMPLDVTWTTGETHDIIADFNTICGKCGLTLEWATALAEGFRRGYELHKALHRAEGG